MAKSGCDFSRNRLFLWERLFWVVVRSCLLLFARHSGPVYRPSNVVLYFRKRSVAPLSHFPRIVCVKHEQNRRMNPLFRQPAEMLRRFGRGRLCIVCFEPGYTGTGTSALGTSVKRQISRQPGIVPDGSGALCKGHAAVCPAHPRMLVEGASVPGRHHESHEPKSGRPNYLAKWFATPQLVTIPHELGILAILLPPRPSRNVLLYLVFT